MFFGLIPFALGFGLGSMVSPRYVPAQAYPSYAYNPYFF